MYLIDKKVKMYTLHNCIVITNMNSILYILCIGVLWLSATYKNLFENILIIINLRFVFFLCLLIFKIYIYL